MSRDRSTVGPHVETATCAICGTRFRRGVAEKWKQLCLSCWAFNKAAEAHDLQRRLLKLVR